MDFISTKNMKNEDAPEGVVLVKYLEPSWGYWNLQYCMAYFDNPNDYGKDSDGRGWVHDNTGNKLNVVEYCKLPKVDQEIENPWYKLTQKFTNESHGTYTPNLGSVVS